MTNPAHFELNAARDEDAPRVAQLLRASRTAFMPYAPPVHSKDEDERWVANYLIPSGGVTLATLGATLVGVLAVRRDDDANWVDQLYLAPDYCGRGIGGILLGHALEELGRPVRLYVFQENAGARRFYARYGFVPVEFSDGSGNEERCPDVLYELPE